jgi:hypothetical protein
MRELLAELDSRDEEHPDTWLQHESGWCLSAHELGILVWENVEESKPPRHLQDVPREKVLDLWIKLSQGRIAEVESEPWQPGYALPTVDRTAADHAQVSQDRQSYNSLGEERVGHPCQVPGCRRGAIFLSVLCRPHHFESIKKRTCPFSD